MSIPVNTGNATGFADGTIFSTTPGDGGIVQVVQLPGTQPVSGTFWQATQPVSGPLTDAQLRAAAVPVSGTFWQATQPVSGTFWQATQPVSIAATVTTDVSDRAARLLGHVTVDNASLAVTGTFWQATQPVSGTFWQATQPVSGPLTDTQLRASAVGITPVDKATSGNISATDANNGASVLGSTSLFNAAPTANSFIALNVEGMSSAEVMAVGAGWTATCYIEGSLDSTTGSDGVWTGILFTNRANPPQQSNFVNFSGARLHGPVGTLKWLRLRCQGGITAGPVPVVLRASMAPAGLEIVAPLPNGGNTIGSVSITNAPAQTKGTQATFFMPVQDARDTGRVNIMWTAEFSPAAVAEALLTLTESRDGAATTTASSKVVTSGKRLVVQSITMAVENTLGVNPKRAKLRMRFNTAGAATATSPLQTNLVASVATAVNTVGATAFQEFPEGLEFLGDGTKQIGFTLEFPDWVTAAQTGKVYVTIMAYEY